MSYRRALVFIAPAIGIAVLCVCAVAWYLTGKADSAVLLFGGSAVFGMSAGGFAEFILYRLESIGWNIPRVPLPAFGMPFFLEYWNMAPRQRWSRLPVAAIPALFLVAIVLLLAAAHLAS